jgi:hypothetical protein
VDLNLAAPRLHDLGYSAHDAEAASYITPPLCTVPAGPFLLGSDLTRDKQARDAELPQQTVTLA